MSLDDPSDEENEHLWLAEAARRKCEVDEGWVQLVEGDEVEALLDRMFPR